jgi:peptidoglycan/LPS O-acetylase OafA/YrhL
MVVAAVLGVGVSILVAAASYEVFEKHFLRLKSRLAPSMHKAPAVVVALDTQLAE